MKLENKSKELRKKILTAIYKAGKGHMGGALSSADILTTLFYTGNNWDFTKKNKDRDRFILSKGHSAIALYAILQDFNIISESDLYQLNKGQLLGEHPDTNIPGVETVAGSLGHGLGISSGISLSLKKRKSNAKVYVLMGDGECYEGSIWESAMFAAHHKLSNLTAIIDRNNLCIHGNTEYINKLDSLSDKFKSMGWKVSEIDGHDFNEITFALFQEDLNNNCPHVIIANTIKGKGISFMENNYLWHHGTISNEQYEKVMEELI